MRELERLETTKIMIPVYGYLLHLFKMDDYIGQRQ